MPDSVFEAIKSGLLDFEPAEPRDDAFEATQALPGSDEKIAVLARRVERGLPLWHPQDRLMFNNREAV